MPSEILVQMRTLFEVTEGNSVNNALPWPIAVLLTIPAVGIILLTIFGNLLVLCFKARVGRTNTTTLLVWNLGLTDFLVGIIVLPIGAFHLISGRWLFGRTLCRIWVGADVTFCTASVVTICVISCDRYLAVTRPLRYKSVVTKFKVIFSIILIWVFSSGVLLATVRWDDHGRKINEYICFAGHEIRYLAHSVIFAFFLPATVTLSLYWRIYRLARNRQRALDRGFLMILGHNMNFLTNTLSQATALRVHIGKSNGRNNGLVEHQRRVLRTHERIAKTLGVVSCSFLFCWLPFFSLYLTNYKCKCIPTSMIEVASWLGYCNSMINPIIYSFTVKEFKRSAKRALLPFWSCLHNHCPRWISKPPDLRITTRMARRQQIRTAPSIEQDMRFRVPGIFAKTNARSATATLMRGVNALLPQSSSIVDKSERRVKITESSSSNKNELKLRSSNNEERSALGQNGILKNRRTNERGQCANDDEIDEMGEDGVVTTTLLLATSRSNMYLDNLSQQSESLKYKRSKDKVRTKELTSICSSSSSSSLLTPTHTIKMPCKPKIKKFNKRHSVPAPSASYLSPANNSSMIEASSSRVRWKFARKRRSSLFSTIKHNEKKPTLYDTLKPKTSMCVETDKAKIVDEPIKYIDEKEGSETINRKK